jgi:uncharacterized lipoprotein YddW (UPF0748 family)
MSIEDWRSNVNTFVKEVSVSIKKYKPWVQFGISPFGVWRNKSVDPKGSDTEVDKPIMTIYLQILSLDGKQMD